MADTKQLLRETRDRIAPPTDVLGGLERRRRHHENAKRAAAAVVGIAIALIGLGGWFLFERGAAPTPAVPAEELGIFAPVSGRIVYGNDEGIWGVDPAAPADDATEIQLTSEAGVPLGWSSDGKRLLIMREIRGEQVEGFGLTSASHLFVLHADGSETQVTERPMGIEGATISADGTRVVFADGTEGRSALYGVDAGGGRPAVLLETEPGENLLSNPTFSPDGDQIAYVDGSGDHSHTVWLMDADGGSAHRILANEVIASAGHVRGMAWSPTGDRIALGLEGSTYTFATDGSGFTQAITRGDRPYWSPDGSRIAYTTACVQEAEGCGLSIADAAGTDLREFDVAASGPWHPGAPAEHAAPAPTPTATATPVVSTGPSALAYGVGGDVFLADVDGANAITIADGVPLDGADCVPGEQRATYLVFGTAWSPDGRYLAYWNWGCPVPDGAWGNVLIADAAGNVIATFPGQGWKISWSPDSTRVAVWDLLWGDDGSTVGIYGLDGERQAALTIPADLLPSGDISPVWSRDGSSILVPGVQVPLDGGEPIRIPEAFGVYSPDGSRFASDRGTLVVEDVDASDAQKTSGSWEFWGMAWSPNGQLIAYDARDRELLVRDVATGADTSLVTVTRPERLGVVAFSPDGERVFFARSNADGSASSLWSVAVDGSDVRRLVDGIEWADLQPPTLTQ